MVDQKMDDSTEKAVRQAIEVTRQELIASLAELTNNHWQEWRQPFLLSWIHPTLKKQGIDYRAVIHPMRLKDFIVSYGADKLKTVVDPIHKAKIGLIPTGERYSYEITSLTQGDALAGSADTRAALHGFLDALATLDRKDLEGFSIPAAILARLSSKR